MELETTLAAIATALLVLSSGTFHLGLVAARRDRARGLRGGSSVTLAARAPRSSASSSFDYSALTFEVSSSAYGTMYYAMTGLHGLHVAAGLVLMLVVLGRAARGALPRQARIDGMHAVGYYWHFVDIVWVGLFATLFLVR